MTIEIKEKLTGSILDIGGGGEAVIGQIYKDRVTAIDNCKEELEEAPDCCSKQLMDATELSFPDDSFDNVTFFYTLMYMTAEEQQKSICEAARVLRVGKQMYIWDCDIRSAYPEPFMIDLDQGRQQQTPYDLWDRQEGYTVFGFCRPTFGKRWTQN